MSKRMPRMRPSPSSASSPRERTSRACSSARNTSERVPVHFTGRPSFFAANSAAQYSGYRLKRTPKPPPTSSAITLIFSGGTPSTAESWLRMIATPCVHV